MLGPGLALRGGEGANSMHKAVENMKSESKHCFYFFMLQLLFFHMSSFLLMWTLYSKPVALVINIILGVFLLLFIWNGKDIYDKLAVSDSEAVSGKFTNFAQYEGMEDLDKGAGQRQIAAGQQRLFSQPNPQNFGSNVVAGIPQGNRPLSRPNNQSFMNGGGGAMSQEALDMQAAIARSNQERPVSSQANAPVLLASGNSFDGSNKGGDIDNKRMQQMQDIKNKGNNALIGAFKQVFNPR